MKRIKFFVFRHPILARQYYRLKNVNSFSQRNFDLVLAAYLPHKRGFYVELGAYNGLYESNSRYFEVWKGWTGILIEPVSYAFERLVQVRSNRNIFCNVACVSFDYLERQAKGGGALSFVQCGAMSFSPDLPSDLPDQNHHLNQAREYLKKISDERGKVRDFSVVTRTLTDVLESNNAPETIDFLSLDVEGHELEVLAGIDFKKYVFTLILIESRNSENTKRYLSRYGYEFVRAVSPTDLLFKKHTSASP